MGALADQALGAKQVVSSSQSSRTIWQDLEGAAAVRAKGKNQKAKGKNPDPELLPFGFCLLPFALTAARDLWAGSPPPMVPAPPGWEARTPSPWAPPPSHGR